MPRPKSSAASRQPSKERQDGEVESCNESEAQEILPEVPEETTVTNDPSTVYQETIPTRPSPGLRRLSLGDVRSKEADNGVKTARMEAIEHGFSDLKKLILNLAANRDNDAPKNVNFDEPDSSEPPTNRSRTTTRLTAKQRRIHTCNQFTKCMEKWRPSISPESWCIAFERALRDYDVHSADHAGCFRRCIPPDVSADLATNDHLADDDYEGWKRVFLQEYGSQTRCPYPIAELYSIKQQRNEPALSTLERLEVARRRIQGMYPERMYYEAYITAFGDSTTRHLRAANIQTFAALKECIRTSMVDFHKHEIIAPAPQAVKAAIRYTGRPVGETCPHSKEYCKANGLCYNCGEKGHMGSRCPKRTGQLTTLSTSPTTSTTPTTSKNE